MSYEVSSKIDYLTFRTEKIGYTYGWNVAKIKEYSPIRGHDTQTIYDNGTVIHFDGSKRIKGSYCTMSGEALDNIREHEQTTDILELIMLSNPEFKRIDICVTSNRTNGQRHELTPHDIALLCHNGKLDSRLKADNHVMKPDMLVETTYIGSRKSRNRLFRAYDKGAMLDLDRHKIIRYELQTNKHPQTIVNQLLEGQSISSIIKRYVDFPNNEIWCLIMGADVSELSHADITSNTVTEREIIENSSRWQWLINSCSTTIAKAMYEDRRLMGIEPNSNINVDLLSHEIALKYNRLIDKL